MHYTWNQTPVNDIGRKKLKSMLDVRWDVAFSETGYMRQYEPFTFHFDDGTVHVPTFYIEDTRTWVDVVPLVGDSGGFLRNMMVLNSSEDAHRYKARSLDNGKFDLIIMSDYEVDNVPDGCMALTWDEWIVGPKDSTDIENMYRSWANLNKICKIMPADDWCIVYGDPLNFITQGTSPMRLSESVLQHLRQKGGAEMKCAECNFFLKDMNSDNGGGYCRRNSPSPSYIPGSDKIFASWPYLHEGKWCGDYQPRQ